MSKYKVILFDADDTLLDFQASETASFKMLFKTLNIQYKEDFFEEYKKINRSLWKSFEKGEIPKEMIMKNRFLMLFDKLNINENSENAEKTYRQILSTSSHTIKGAIDICKKLKDTYDLYIVTNGIAKTQFGRLEKSGLDKLIKKVYVSEDIGYQKPSKEYFEAVFKDIPNINLKETIIIGDSLTSDIKGGINAGIDTCWYNPKKTENDTDIKPTYEINNLEEIFNVLE